MKTLHDTYMIHDIVENKDTHTHKTPHLRPANINRNETNETNIWRGSMNLHHVLIYSDPASSKVDFLRRLACARDGGPVDREEICPDKRCKRMMRTSSKAKVLPMAFLFFFQNMRILFSDIVKCFLFLILFVRLPSHSTNSA